MTCSKNQTSPMACGFLAGAYFFIAALLIAQLACAATSYEVRTPVQQYSAAVKIQTSCMSMVDGEPVVQRFGGTGVITDAHHVLTAAHVVTCPAGATAEVSIASHVVTISDAFTNADIARLYVADSMAGIMSPVKMGRLPKFGDRVCEASRVPRNTWRCGVTQEPDDQLIRFEMRVEHGNSGSGLYNAQGELIGIVVQWWPCENYEMCGGKAEPIQKWPWLVR